MPPFVQGLLVILAYLLGSVPSAVWLGRAFRGVDVREHGSGNAGATNTFRTLGWKIGVPVLLIDVFKGFIAVKLALLISRLEPGSDAFVNYQLILGTSALIGHVFPLFAKFKGGKGVATLLGFMIGVEPNASLLCLAIFILMLVSTRIVSISSMTAALSFPFVVILIFKNDTPSLMIFSAVIAIAVIVTHRENIKRLFKREESKVSFKKKSTNSQPAQES